MNERNLNYLKEGLKYLGFSDKLNTDLENHIKQQPPEFKLNVSGEFGREGGKDKVDFVLDFKKSDQTDMYFFNRYQATLKNHPDPTITKAQTFYITKNSGITAKEAYNLLSGRAVNKELKNKDDQPFNAWLQLDFKEKDKNDNYKVNQFHQGYGYDLEAVVKRYPIKELANDDDRQKLMKSLHKGNLQQVTFAREGRETKMFIEANPQYKTLNLYDSKMEKIFQGIDKREKDNLAQSQDKTEKLKSEPDDDGPTTSKKTNKKRKVGI